MELLTQHLPSGYPYEFNSIHIMPMKFAEILEYLENAPNETSDPVERYYFDYCVIKGDDPNIDRLLLIDLEYCIYMKKGMTISTNMSFSSSHKCPKCGEVIPYTVNIANIKFNKLDEEAAKGIRVEFGSQYYNVMMPTVSEFMKILSRYRRYRKKMDLRIIKLISLFTDAQIYHQKIEDMIINATHKDITVLLMLDKIYFDFIDPLKIHCDTCSKLYNPTKSDLINLRLENDIPEDAEIPDYILNKFTYDKGGIEIGLQSLVSDFFHDLVKNNRLVGIEILPGEIRGNA